MPDLTTLITTALTTALTADNGRHAVLMVSDGPLRQTVLALRQGSVSRSTIPRQLPRSTSCTAPSA